MNASSTQDRIVDAATRLILERGYAATTVDQIVAAARVAKGSVYHFFDSKEAVGRAALDAYFQRGLAVVAVGSYTTVEDPVARTFAFLDHLEGVSPELWAHGCLGGTLSVELEALGPGMRDAVAGWMARIEQQLERMLEPAAAASRIPDGPTAGELAAQLLAAVEGAIVVGRARGEPERIARAIREFRRYVRAIVG
jgi:TetR/AcrR family transcriptional repressor of nem operon